MLPKALIPVRGDSLRQAHSAQFLFFSLLYKTKKGELGTEGSSKMASNGRSLQNHLLVSYQFPAPQVNSQRSVPESKCRGETGLIVAAGSLPKCLQ